MKIKYATLSTLYFVGCMMALTLYTALNMRTMEHGVEPIVGTRPISLLCLVAMAGALTKFWWVPGYQCYRPSRTLALYLIYMLWVIVPTILNPVETGTLSDLAIALVAQIIPMFSAVLIFNYVMNHGDKRWLLWVFAIMYVAYVLMYAKIFLELLSSGEIIQMVVSYYTLYMLPLLLLTAGKKTRLIFIFITLLVLTTSMKRGGLVAFAGGMVVYGVVYMLTAKRISRWVVAGAIAVGALLAGLFVYIGTSDEANVVERFESSESDEGSGRFDVWSHTWSMIENSDFLPLVAGHGYNKVEEDSLLGLSAHNDLLEITYDYGLVGLALYLAACLSLVGFVLRLIKRKSAQAPAAAMLLAVYGALSMISHIAIYPWFNIILLSVSYITAREITHEQNSL